MAFYVLRFLNSTKKLSDERSFFYHNDVIVKRMTDIYRKKLKVIDTFSFDEFISLAAHDEEEVAFFIKTKIDLDDYSEWVIEKCYEKNIPVILKDDFLNVPFNIRHANMISNDIADKSNIILNYCVTNNRKNLAVYGLNPRSNADMKLAEGIYQRWTALEPEDIYTVVNGLDNCYESFFENRDKYDVVILVNDLVAIDLIERLKHSDPEYIEKTFFIGSMDSLLSRLYYPSLTSSSYKQTSGAIMLYRLYELCVKNRNDFGSVNIMLKNYFTSRDTTANIPFEQSNACFKLTSRKLNFESSTEEIDTPDIPIMLESMLSSIDINDLKIIGMLIRGKTAFEIADSLFMSLSSVKHKMSNLYKLLNVKRKKDFIDTVKPYINLKYLDDYIREQSTV